MKKYAFLTLFALAFIFPINVNAEEKIIGDYKYTIETKTYKDYVCDEIEGKKYRFFTNLDNTKVILSLINEAPAYDYLIDFTKTNNCTPMTQQQSDEFFSNDTYSYFWGKDNVIRKVKWTYDDVRLFVLTKDTIVDPNKSYFKLTDLTITEIEPIESEISTYYEEIYLKMASEYDPNAHYYEDNNDGTVTRVGQITEEKFNDGELYYTELTSLDSEDVITLNNTDFLVSKETGIFGADYKYDRSDYLDVFSVDGSTYLMFSEENLGDPVVFDLAGNIIKFGFDKVMSPSTFETSKNGLLGLIIGPTYDASKIYIMNSDYNILYEQEAKDYFIKYLTSNGNTDYFAIDSHTNDNFDIKILEITKSKKEVDDSSEDAVKEIFDNPKTSDNIVTNILIAIISFTCLICIVYFKRKNQIKA